MLELSAKKKNFYVSNKKTQNKLKENAVLTNLLLCAFYLMPKAFVYSQNLLCSRTLQQRRIFPAATLTFPSNLAQNMLLLVLQGTVRICIMMSGRKMFRRGGQICGWRELMMRPEMINLCGSLVIDNLMRPANRLRCYSTPARITSFFLNKSHTLAECEENAQKSLQGRFAGGARSSRRHAETFFERPGHD